MVSLERLPIRPLPNTMRLRASAALLALLALAGCAGAARSAQGPVEPVGEPAGAYAPRRQPFTEADVRFMTGMIHHHAQAIVMAGWAPTHGANRAIRAMSERIVVGQRDEIAIMAQWLRDRGLPVPAADAAHGMMPGMDHPPLMPGMLTAGQLRELDAARGAEFDRLFLRSMIMHHEGAVTMVRELMGSYGAAQDDLVFKLAADINVDQRTEIARMMDMLDALSLDEAPR